MPQFFMKLVKCRYRNDKIIFKNIGVSFWHFRTPEICQNDRLVRPVFTPAVFISRLVLMMNSVHLRVQFNETYNAFFLTLQRNEKSKLYSIFTPKIFCSVKKSNGRYKTLWMVQIRPDLLKIS